MKDEDRKLLVEFEGLTEFDAFAKLDIRTQQRVSVGEITLPENWWYPTFLTWQDLGDLKEKLVEKDEWNEFIKFCWTEHHGHGKYCYSSNREFVRQVFTDWLINPARFAELVVGFMKRE